MTTRTQWVRNVPDSHLKRLILQTVFHVAQESQPGKTIGVLSRLVVTGENPANHVFVELEMERQGHLLSNSRTAPVGITLLHFDDRTDEFCARTLRAGLAAIRGEQHPVLSFAHGFMNGSERLRNGADELDAPRAPSSQRGSGPTRVDWEIVCGSDSRSGVNDVYLLSRSCAPVEELRLGIAPGRLLFQFH